MARDVSLIDHFPHKLHSVIICSVQYYPIISDVSAVAILASVCVCEENVKQVARSGSV